MNRLIIVIIAIIILGSAVTCSKSNNSTKPTPLCTTCSVAVVAHKTDSTGFYYFLPTAFTPNGDGINDVYRVIYDSLDAGASILTIWNASSQGVYAGDLTQSWNGTDLNGNKCAAGKYYVSMKLVTLKGQTIAACTCVTILQFKGSCIYTGGITYYFGDEVDPVNGFAYPTNENLCP